MQLSQFQVTCSDAQDFTKLSEQDEHQLPEVVLC